MRTHAQAVIVGGGVAGCSIAYHLTLLGWRESTSRRRSRAPRRWSGCCRQSCCAKRLFEKWGAGAARPPRTPHLAGRGLEYGHDRPENKSLEGLRPSKPPFSNRL